MPYSSRGAPAEGPEESDSGTVEKTASVQAPLPEPFDPVETPRLCIRCVRSTDADRIADLIRPETSRWLANWPTPFTPEMARERIAAFRAAAFARQAMPCAVVVRHRSELVGWIEVCRMAENPTRGSLGYWLGEPYQGRGFMYEAVAALLLAAIAFLDLESIHAGAQPGNLRSLSIISALGMQFVGEVPVFAPARGRYETCAFYELMRPMVANGGSGGSVTRKRER